MRSGPVDDETSARVREIRVELGARDRRQIGRRALVAATSQIEKIRAPPGPRLERRQRAHTLRPRLLAIELLLEPIRRRRARDLKVERRQLLVERIDLGTGR